MYTYTVCLKNTWIQFLDIYVYIYICIYVNKSLILFFDLEKQNDVLHSGICISKSIFRRIIIQSLKGYTEEQQ